MNSPFTLFAALFLALSNVFIVNAQHAKSYSSAVNKDTVSNYYRLMDVRIHTDSSLHANHTVTFTNRTGKPVTVDFSRVYELSFYLIAHQKSTLKLVLYSGEKASETLIYNLDKSTGRYQKVIFPMFLGDNFDPSHVTSIQISIASEKGSIQIDEFVFNYFDIPTDTKTGQPNLDSEILKKEYQKYREKNQNQIRTEEPESDDTWTKGNKSVKAK